MDCELVISHSILELRCPFLSSVLLLVTYSSAASYSNKHPDKLALPIDVQDTQGTMENAAYNILRRNFYELLEQVVRLLVPATQALHSYLH